MKHLKNIIPRSWKPFLKELVPKPVANYQIHKAWRQGDPTDWPLAEHAEKQDLARYEYSLFSQNGEDGILRYLFSEIGFKSRFFIEFGFGVTESNSLRLMLLERFGGVFIDGSELSVKRFNQAVSAYGISNVKAICKFLNLDNLEETILDSQTPTEIDLLSIDVDGNDYWFWDAIQCTSPRLVVIEYNASLGPDLSLTVPYDPSFDRFAKHESGFYCGASLTALVKLGTKKGYTLVGCDSTGVNAFFTRSDCLTPELRRISSQCIFQPHKSRLDRGYSSEEQLRIIRDLPFTQV